jgi:hypothetical protein
MYIYTWVKMLKDDDEYYSITDVYAGIFIYSSNHTFICLYAYMFMYLYVYLYIYLYVGENIER